MTVTCTTPSRIVRVLLWITTPIRLAIFYVAVLLNRVARIWR